MNVAFIYARLYLDCSRRALASIAKSPWTLLLPMGLFLALQLAGVVASSLGILAGIVLGLVLAALGSCYLYFLGEVVANARVQLSEFRKSIGAYFWSVANVLFVYWIASFVVGSLLSHSPEARSADIALRLVALVLLNAVPEVIYQRHTYGGLATIQRAVQFLQANWLEWGVPNILLLFGLWLVLRDGLGLVVELGKGGLVLWSVVFGSLLHLVMVFRGHLFAALDGSSHRQRMFRYRTAA
ncbi:MAG: hypothetical protein ACLPJH_07895 [Myxococcaceae bacterium]